MGEKNLEQQELSFNGLGFMSRVDDSLEYRNLFAVFFFVSERLSILEINKKLAEKNMRPITCEEFEDFFIYHHLTLSQLSRPIFVCSHPDSVKSNRGDKESSLVPLIRRDGDGELQMSEMVIDKSHSHGEYISAGGALVVAIEDGVSDHLG